jgi:hypothetical protein
VTRYLLSVYQPDGPVPEPEVLDQVMADLEVLNAEMRAAGAWVFAGGLHPPSTATVVRSRDAALGWAARLAEATTLPIEVRPFQGDPGD